MDDGWRRVVCLILMAAGLVWWFGVELYRENSRDHSRRMFWLHLTAPIVSILLSGIGLWLVLGSSRFQR